MVLSGMANLPPTLSTVLHAAIELTQAEALESDQRIEWNGINFVTRNNEQLEVKCQST